MWHPVVLVLAVSLAACREKPAVSKKSDTVPSQAEPVKVAVTRDSLQASSASVPASGGTITAVGSDGSRFTLTIPPNALDGDSTITMTPVSAIEGLPLSGGLVAAVHFEPEGLRFNTPVELRIEPPREVPVEQQVGFGYLGAGDDLHLYPLQRGRALAMRLLHFSGVGVGLGTSTDVRGLQQRPPADPAAKLEQQIAALLNADRQAGLTGGEPDTAFSTKLSELLQEFYDEVVLPKIDAAMKTDDWRVMFDAVQTATFFTRVSAMVNQDATALSKLLPLLEPILVRGFDRAYYRCIQKLGGDKEAGMLMIVARNAALTIFGISADDPRFPQRKIDQCFAGGTPLPPHLELSFESAFLFETANGTKASMTVGSTVKLDQSAGTTSYRTQDWTPIKYRDLKFTAGADCPSYTDVKVNDGRWRVDLMVHPDGKIGMMWYFNALEGIPTEQMTIVPCPGSGGHSRPTFARWWWACLNQVSSQDVEQAMEQGKGYVGLPTGMTLFPRPGILAATIKRTDFGCKEAVITLRLKVVP